MLSTAVAAVELNKEYTSANGERVCALRNANVKVGRGEFVSVVGRSGSGKTTLLHLLGTLEKADSGQLEVLGLATSSLSANELAGLRSWSIGFVFQNFCLFEDLTALENVSTGLLYRGTTRGERAALALACLERVGLAHRGRHFPRELSGGERQRVAIARAIVGERLLLLADEPTGNLDLSTARTLWDSLREVADSGVAVIVATHDVASASVSDREIKLQDGVVIN